MKWGNLQGLIPLLGGLYALLLAHGILPRNPQDAVKIDLWRRKFGDFIKVLAPFVMIFGVLQLLGLFG